MDDSSMQTMATHEVIRLRSRSYEQVEQWLIEALARLSDADAADIDIDRAFIDYQLDSSVAVTLAQQLGEWGDAELQATIFWEFPNIRELATALHAH